MNGQEFLVPRFHSVNIARNIPFARVTDYRGNAVALTLDVYHAGDDAATHRPVIVWIHGGGFREGVDKTQNYIVRYATDFAKRGYVCIAMDYRVRAEIPTPEEKLDALADAVSDARTALTWIRAHSAEYSYDPRLIFLAGGSGGGRTAVNLGLLGQGVEGVRAIANLWGGPEPLFRIFKTIPGSAIPIIFIHGTADTLVPFQASQQVYAQMLAAGALAEMHGIPGAPHTPVGTEYDAQNEDWIAKFFAARF